MKIEDSVRKVNEAYDRAKKASIDFDNKMMQLIGGHF